MNETCGADYCVGGKVHLYSKKTRSMRRLPCPTCAAMHASEYGIVTMVDVPVGEYL